MSIKDQKVSAGDVSQLIIGFSQALECLVVSLKQQPGFDEKGFNESLQWALDIPELSEVAQVLITKWRTEKTSAPTDL